LSEDDGLSRKRALIIGINYYESFQSLNASVSDALAVSQLLNRHESGLKNYECITLTAANQSEKLNVPQLRKAIQKLFEYDGEVLLYFSGHGFLTATGGYLCGSDASDYNWGMPMQEVMDLANQSRALEVLIMLDCCHSGDAANASFSNSQNTSKPLALIRKDLTVIAASLDRELAFESGGHGLFTQAMIDALDGGAADLFGAVTSAGMYAYIERRFGAWGQRPVFKSHTTFQNVVRSCIPKFSYHELQRLPALFPEPEFEYPLDPEYEPEDEHGNVKLPVNVEKREIAKLFKVYRDAGLLSATEKDQQLFWAAKNSATVKLTARGRECWWLLKNNKI
jgi:hypothetical protein